MKRTKKESAVSPVVGVMLMLVVTIIIAAVVAAFAGGLVGSAEKAPSAVLDVHIYSAHIIPMSAGDTKYVNPVPDFTIAHKGGDDLNTANIKMSFTYTNKTGAIKTSTFDKDSTNFTFEGGYGDREAPSAMYLNNGQDYAYEYPSGTVNPSVFFGNATLSSGYQLQTIGNYLNIYAETQTGNPAMDVIFGNGVITSTKSGTTYSGGIMDDLKKGTVVHVVITDTKSNIAIFDKEVVVE